MLSPTSQTAVDGQSRSSFPLSLSLFIYLSQVPSCSHWGLSISCPPSTRWLSPSLGPFTLTLSSYVFFIWIFQSFTFPFLFIIQHLIRQPFFITFFPPIWKWKLSYLFIQSKLLNYIFLLSSALYFLPQLSDAMENREGNCMSKTKISNTDVLRFSQSRTGCCYFKILSLHCKFCCLWQIYRLSKTTTPFKISYRKIVNILVFAWSAKSGGNFIVYHPS